MALVLKDRVKETTVTAGTGTITLAGASVGYQSFSAIGNANTTYYCIAGQGTTEWEVGIGTYTASGTTLSRDTILASSNSGSVVTFSAGTKDVFVVYPAGKSVNLDASGNATALGTPASGTVTNLTGTASININGTVGATTPTTGAFTTISATGAVTFPAGTALLPSITTTGDTNTGIFFPAADTIAFTEGGSERMRIDSSGNVGIGTSSPGAKLDVNGGTNSEMRVTTSGSGYLQVGQFTNGAFIGTSSTDATAGILRFGTGGSERMRIDSSGNVGIGTNTPATYGKFCAVSASPAIYRLMHSGNSGSDTVTLSLGSDNSGYLSSHASIVATQNGGVGGYSLDILSSGTGTRITLQSSGTNNYLGFLTSGTERMRISSSGNVGIGTASPGLKLHVVGTIGAIQNGSDSYGVPSFYQSNTANDEAFAWQQSAVGSKLYLWTYSTSGGTGWTNRFTFLASGNLGVGLTGPSARVHTSAGDGTYLLAGSGTTKGFRVLTDANQTSIQGVDTTLTGSYQPLTFSGSDLRFQTNGTTEQMRIDSSGNVGIGTASPAAGTRLKVTGANGTALAFFNGTTKGIRFGFDTVASSIEGVDNTGFISYQPLSVGGSSVSITASGAQIGLFTSTGLSVTGELSATVADAAISSRLIATTGRIRIRPYVDATLGAVFESTDTPETAYLPLSLFGSVVKIGNGANVSISSSGLTVTPGTITTGSTTALSLATSGGTIATFNNVASQVNYWYFYGNTAGNSPAIQVAGSDTNVDATFSSKGTGALRFYTNAVTNEQVRITHTASANRYITLTGSNGGNPTIGTSAGDLYLAAATGSVGIGTTTNTNSSALYIAQAGNSRMLQLTSSAADSSAGVGFTNDARAWNAAVRGDSSDNFIIRDITAGVDVVKFSSAGMNLTGDISAATISGSVVATQANQETATSTTTIVTPGRQQYHPSAAKAWVNFNGTGTVAIRASFNVSSITDNGLGDYTVNFTTAFSSANYAYALTGGDQNVTLGTIQVSDTAPTASAFRFLVVSNTATPQDSVYVSGVFFGDQ